MTSIAVIGPSGCGKSSVVRELHRRGLVRVHPTWTTRPPRPDERSGSLEHRFVTEEVFDELRRQDFFLATGNLFGLPWRYGLPVVRPASDSAWPVDLVMLRAPLVERLRAPLGLSLVVHVEDDAERILRRLVARGSGAADVRARIADNAHEVALGRAVADVTLRNDGTISSLADAVAAVIGAHVDVDVAGAVR